jgi:hypothetical protein
MLKRFVVTTSLLLTTATGASAQQWDAPLFFAPYGMDELGLYYINSDVAGPFDNPQGLKLIWRQTGNLNLGVHAGVGDFDFGESLILGAELYGPLRALSGSTGLAVNWGLGLGAAFGKSDDQLGREVDYILFSIPLGASIGLRLGTGGIAITPFVHPRVSFDVLAETVEGFDEETHTDVGFAADLGAEIGLGQRFLLRGAYSLGDRDAFGVGLAMRTPRRVIAR